MKRVLAFLVLATTAWATTGTWSITGLTGGTWTAVNNGDGTYAVNFSGVWTQPDNGHSELFLLETNASSYPGYNGGIVSYTHGTSGHVFTFSNVGALEGTMGTNATFYWQIWNQPDTGAATKTATATVTITSPPSDYRADFTFTNNTVTIANIQFVVASSGDFIGAQAVQPNSSVTYHFTAASNLDVRVEKEVPSASKVGASWVAGGEGGNATLMTFTPQVFSDGDHLTPYLVNVSGPAAPLGDGLKAIWVTSSSTLNGDLYREGVDKIAGAIYSTAAGAMAGGSGSFSETDSSNLAGTNEKLGQVKTKLDDIKDAVKKGPVATDDDSTNVTGGAETLSTNLETKAGALRTALAPWAVTRGNLTAPSAAPDNFSFGAIPMPGGATALELAPFTYFDWLREYAHYIREALLWGIAIGFVMWGRAMLESYMKTYFTAPQLTTRVDPVEASIVLGAGKHALVVAGWFAAALVLVAACIVAFNTEIGLILTGMNVAGIASGAGSALSTITGATAPIAKAYSFLGEFIPFPALFQALSCEIVFSFSLPALFASAMLVAKGYRL